MKKKHFVQLSCHGNTECYAHYKNPSFLLFFSFSLQHIVRPDYVGRSRVPDWPDYIEINDQEQIDGLARACQLARHVLLLAGRSLRVGNDL